MNPDQANPSTPDPPRIPPSGEGLPDAPLGPRILAAFIDFLMALGITMVLDQIHSSLGFPAAVAYIVLRDCLPFLDGQSIGKKAMRLRAVTSGGHPLTANWNPGVLRNILLIIPFFPLVELIVLLTRNHSTPLRRLGDEWFDTKVVALQ